jgi:hypothetical protein
MKMNFTTLIEPETSNARPIQYYSVAPYGDHPHERGLQCFSKAAAERLVKRFKGWFGIPFLRFTRVPVYIGHPDDPELQELPGHQDARIWGYVRDLKVTDEGLMAAIDWTEEGEALIASGKYQSFSPRWTLIRRAEGEYVPHRLLSLGLTNRPNIAGAHCQPIRVHRPQAQDPATPPYVLICPNTAQEATKPLKTASETLHLPHAGRRSPNGKKQFLNHVQSVSSGGDEAYLTHWMKAKRLAKGQALEGWLTPF